MSFVFASSHLPEVKRPDDEEEDEEDNVQPMQRSGMVRAFSHLPQPVVAAPAAPRAAAPASRPAWAAAPEAPSGHEAEDGHEPEPDDDADDGHGSSASTGAHEADDGRPWYQPRITAADLQPEGGEHDDPAKDNVGPVPRLSGGAGSFRPLPEPVEDDAVNEHADAGSHVDFEPPATAGSDTLGTIGPVTPRGAAPAAGRSLFLTPRPMPPEYARQMARTYGSAPGSRGSGGPPGSGDKPAATAPSTRPVTIQDLRDAHKKYEAAAEPTVAPGNATVSRPAGPTKIAGFTVMDQELYKKKQEFDTDLEKQQEMGKAADIERAPLEANAKNIGSLGGLRTTLKITKAAQDMAKRRMPKKYRDTFDKINKETGLAPAEQIKNVDAKITASEGRTSELKENAKHAEEAHQKALKETQAAWKSKKELEEKLEQQRKQQLNQERKQTLAPLPWMPPIENADPA